MPHASGRGKFAGRRAPEQGRGFESTPGKPDLEGLTLEGFDHIPVPRKSRRVVNIPLPGSICLSYSQFPAWHLASAHVQNTVSSSVPTTHARTRPHSGVEAHTPAPSSCNPYRAL